MSTVCHLAKPVVLHLAPHPDDELLGAPATLMALRDAGYRVVNLACGLGRPEQRERREAELREACARARFELLVPPRPAAISSRDERPQAEEELRAMARETIEALAPRIVVSPSPHDRHPGHELVARAIREELRGRGESAPVWWMWGLWASLPHPTLASAFDGSRLDEVLVALEAHRGELGRRDFGGLLRARAEAAAVAGPELLFGFGSLERAREPFVELLTEVVEVKGRWMYGSSRWLDPDAALQPPTAAEAGAWVDAPSAADLAD